MGSCHLSFRSLYQPQETLEFMNFLGTAIRCARGPLWSVPLLFPWTGHWSPETRAPLSLLRMQVEELRWKKWSYIFNVSEFSMMCLFCNWNFLNTQFIAFDCFNLLLTKKKMLANTGILWCSHLRFSVCGFSRLVEVYCWKDLGCIIKIKAAVLQFII